MDKLFIPEAIANESQPKNVQNYVPESVGNQLAQEGVIRLSGTQSVSSPGANNPIINDSFTPNKQAVVTPKTPVVVNLKTSKISETSYWDGELEKAKV